MDDDDAGGTKKLPGGCNADSQGAGPIQQHRLTVRIFFDHIQD
jgi:hypothetical protein